MKIPPSTPPKKTDCHDYFACFLPLQRKIQYYSNTKNCYTYILYIGPCNYNSKKNGKQIFL